MTILVVENAIQNQKNAQEKQEDQENKKHVK